MDKVTGLGQTLEEFTLMNGDMLLNGAYELAKEEKKAAQVTECDCDDVDIIGKDLLLGGEIVARLDDLGYSVLGKFLGIPVPYLLKLPTDVRNVNCQYWLGQKSGKQVKVFVRENNLVDINAAESIERVDVLDILNDSLFEGHILKTLQQTNSTVFDIYSPIKKYEAGGRSFYGGLRAVLKNGLNAPEIVPIFLDIDSCAIIECAEFTSQPSIRGLTYSDILRVIRSITETMVSAIPSLFNTYSNMCDDTVNDPRRRIALYAREHNIPDRVCAYALKQYDDMHMSGARTGDIIALFSGMGFIDEVKQASERKLQRLAGYVVVRAHSERRCSACDSRLLEE